jgi:hypothetical protein
MHKKQSSRPGLSRRGFLKLAAAAGATAAAGHVLFTYAPWLDYDGQVRQTWDSPFQKEANPPAQMREIVRYAGLAASSHNTQPWRFALQDDAIQIHPDYSRRLPVVDPHERELWISLGCALENLVIAAQTAGYESDITYPTPDADHVTVHLQAAGSAASNPLFEAIPVRQNTRSPYSGQPGHAVVGAHLQPHDLVPLAGARGEHEDGHAHLAAQDAAHLEAVQTGQHHVQHQGIRTLIAGQLYGSPPSAAVQT